MLNEKVLAKLIRQVTDLQSEVNELKSAPEPKVTLPAPEPVNMQALVDTVLEQIPTPEPVDTKALLDSLPKAPTIAEVLEALAPRLKEPPTAEQVAFQFRHEIKAIGDEKFDRSAMVGEVLEQIPKPADGIAGKDGKDGKAGRDGKDGAKGKDGADGKSVEKLDIKNGELFYWIDGVKRSAGKIPVQRLSAIAGSGGLSARRPWYSKEIVVTKPEQMGGQLRSDVVYKIDGVVDFTGSGYNITVPSGGITIKGHSINVSSLTCSDPDYTLFDSPEGGSGTIFFNDMTITTSGENSQVFDLTDATGFNALEMIAVNFIDCSSRGIIRNYRQGLEDGNSYFGGKPTLTMAGTWLGGYRITTSLVRSLDAAMTTALFSAGENFKFTGRVITDINVDLGASASLFDFAPVNVPIPSSLIIRGATIFRNGVSNPSDLSTMPNITADYVGSMWTDNVGLNNTYVGGKLAITAENLTNIPAANTYVDLAGTYGIEHPVHFDTPQNGQLRHAGQSPNDYRVDISVEINGGAGDQIALRIAKFNSVSGQFEFSRPIRRFIVSAMGPGDYALFTDTVYVTINQNDYIKLEVANLSDATNITALVDGYFLVSKRP